MIEKFKEELKREITFYREDVENIELRLKETQGKNGYNVNPILSDRSKISFLLNYLKDTKTDTETFNLKEYEKILNFLDKKFEKIKQRKDFQEKCLDELETLANNWTHTAQHTFSGPENFMHDLEWRDEYEAILKELKDDKEILKIKEKIKEADKKLQKTAPQLLKRFHDFYENSEWDYYPKSYWWRHLKEFAEKQEGKK
ncbi:hypothetical protein KKG83_04385 [Candidatus Micrarchaeota archaeon]|nr:hypothetical protein [Candidatus Micrarchaeota archaeon]